MDSLGMHYKEIGTYDRALEYYQMALLNGLGPDAREILDLKERIEGVKEIQKLLT